MRVGCPGIGGRDGNVIRERLVGLIRLIGSGGGEVNGLVSSVAWMQHCKYGMDSYKQASLIYW